MSRLHLTAVVMATAIAVAACSSTGTSLGAGPSTTSGGQGSSAFSAAPPTTVAATTASPNAGLKVSEHDFTLALSANSVPSGNVSVTIDNQGPSSHELLVFRTNLPADQLPLGPDGRINEDALPKVVDTGTDVASGSQRALTAPLTTGRYVLVCNLPGHYKAGMHAVLTVS